MSFSIPPEYRPMVERDPNPAIAKATSTGRLTLGQYEAFAASLPAPIVGAQTSEVQAGYLLGIQFVLAELKRTLVK